MPKEFFIETPANFSFFHTIYSHGWSDLKPFEVDEANDTLKYVFLDGGKPIDAIFVGSPQGINVKLSRSIRNTTKLTKAIRHVLRLDDHFDDFYGRLDEKSGLLWAAEVRAGRLLRSPTVWEDLVKTMCTTNCSWGLTKNMVGNLVQKLGQHGTVFPTVEAMASVDEKFYREEIKAGYRSPYFVELAAVVADGLIDPEAWLVSALPTPELKKQIKSVKGIGDYAAENLLKLLGRYDGLALDSWLRAQFYKEHNRGKVCPDKKIIKHYSKYSEWQGLAIWCDMTKEWFENK
jgi:3-methyladenine DNA glycosylase/8-oxoguanine DNA glycosylase